jgi:hypothetical protein
MARIKRALLAPAPKRTSSEPSFRRPTGSTQSPVEGGDLRLRLTDATQTILASVTIGLMMNDDFETVTAAIADAFTRQDAEGIVRNCNDTRRFYLRMRHWSRAERA